jgi:chemotaxis protein methyltransferase CheR
MKKATFDKFCELIYSHCGITLSDGKEALVTARIGKRLRALNIPDHEAYLRHVENDQTQTEIVQLLDAISTNVTSFWREPAHFTYLQQAVQNWIQAGQRSIKVWCAASSTGEEPYTLAITIKEALAGKPIDVKILATDISTKVLATAQAGIYDESKIRGVPQQILSRHFNQRVVNGAKCYEICPDTRRLIHFHRLNLAKPPFPMRGPFDAVFCRNVMIYFDNTVRSRMLKEMHRLIRSGGFLAVGHSESLSGLMTEFKTVQPAVYVRS